VGKMQNILNLNLVVHIVTTGLESVEEVSLTHKT